MTTELSSALDMLCDEGSPVDWSVSADVVVRIGEPALLPLAEVLASAESPEVARRAMWALARLEGADPEICVPLLRHPHAEVRSTALSPFKSLGEAAIGYADRLIPLLGDPEADVRQRAVRTFQEMGGAAVPVLRRLRQEPATGPRVRVTALEALAAIGGPSALSDRDLAAWRRLTRIKQLTETPESLHLCGSWYAVPSVDRSAVPAAFDLSDPEPVTLRTGASAWNHDKHNWRGKHPHERCARVFVGPAMEAWTLVFGNASQDTHRTADTDDQEAARAEVARERCAGLSRRFGAAHWYGMSCGDGWTAWCIAEGGEVVRFDDAFEAEEKGIVGTRHPAESGRLLPHEIVDTTAALDAVGELPSGAGPLEIEAFYARYEQARRELGIPDTCYATDIAAQLSVNPGALGARTRITGSGVLALTACGREHGHPAGALRV
ncbi:HEAT repeat domain-containing protein [Streptomyces sp. WM6386]|uniref:HEAT repeat domain-containing protein n=1 Tax=Streptomyces sp. WM6386 TaxID=1415558 RepID=UPI000698C271|nr:HEAT repeat domain-containing protein [Streptomyces sp. WM6386]